MSKVTIWSRAIKVTMVTITDQTCFKIVVRCDIVYIFKVVDEAARVV